ncbi:MAG: HEAT repeat domain-containing protein [Planctomycetia bacterium]|nr:MAG: HEAT repeat domain-containing protein [Planctomycetia bacterium]
MSVDRDTTRTPRPAKGIVWNDARRAVEEFLRHAQDSDALAEYLPRLAAEAERHGEAFFPPLIEALDHSETGCRLLAALLIVHTAEERPDLLDDRDALARATAVLTDGLRQETVDDRLRACVLLTGYKAPPAAVPLLKRMMDDPDERLRVCAAAALSLIDAGNAQLIQTLRHGLHSELPALVQVAAHAFARLGVHSAEPLGELIALLDSPDERYWYPALLALKQLGPSAAMTLGPLREFLADRRRPPSLRGFAAVAIGHVTRGSDGGIPALMGALSDAEPLVVNGAVDGLVEGGHASAMVVSRFAELIASPCEETRIAAARGLAAIGSRAAQAVPALAARVGKETNPRMIEVLARALGGAGTAAVPALTVILRGHDILVVPVVAAAFMNMGTEGIAALAATLRTESDAWTRVTLVAIVRELGASAASAVPALAGLLDETDDEELAACLIAAIHATGPGAAPAAPALVRCLVAGSDELASWCERALWSIGPDAAATVEAAIHAAQGDSRIRLENVLAGMRRDDDRRYIRFEQVEETDLQRFVLVADLFAEHGPLSLRAMEAMLRERTRSGLLAHDFSISASEIRLTLEKIEAHLGAPATDRGPGRKGGLTDEGRRLASEAKAFLQWKAKRRDDAEPR